MPYAVRFHDVDYGNGGAVRTGVLGCYVTKKIANNAARDHFAGWQDDFCEYMDCEIGEVFHEEYVDGMIDINAITPEGLTTRAWVERSTNTMKKRKPEGMLSHEYLVKSEDVDYRNPHGPGQYDVVSNMQGPYDTLEEANDTARAHFRKHCHAEIAGAGSEVVPVRDYVEDKTPEGMLLICGVVGETNMRAWVEARPARAKISRPSSVLPIDATSCPFCGRAADQFPTGMAGLSRHVRLCPQKALRGPHPHLVDQVHMPVVAPSEVPQPHPELNHTVVPPHNVVPQDENSQDQFPPPLTNYLMNAAATLAAPLAVPSPVAVVMQQPPPME